MPPYMRLTQRFPGDETFERPTFVRDKYGFIVEAEGVTSGLDHILGLSLKWINANTVELAPGEAYIPGLDRIVSVSSPIQASKLTGVHLMYFAYLSESNGVGQLLLTIEPPSAPYVGTARNRIGDANVRYLGTLRNNSVGTITPFHVVVLGGNVMDVMYTSLSTDADRSTINSPPFNDTVLTPFSVGYNGATAQKRLVAPAAERATILCQVNNNGTKGLEIGSILEDGSPHYVQSNNRDYVEVVLTPSQQYDARMSATGTGNSANMYVSGYIDRR